MSSPSLTASPTRNSFPGGSGGADGDGDGGGTCYRQTFWCHACDMSVSLLCSPSSHLLCPHCNGDFLEHMDSSPSPSLPQIPQPDQSSNPPFLSSFVDPFNTSSARPVPFGDSDSDPEPDPDVSSPAIHISQDHLLSRLSSPYLDHLIHRLAADPNSDARRSSPASKSSVESIPTVKITVSILAASDPLFCAVCKDQFVVDVEAKQLPCNHIYHCDCILPWLAQHNSCPVCRFRLPTDEPDLAPRYDMPVMDDNLMERDEDLLGLERAVRRIARRHRLIFPARSSLTQLAQASLAAGPANSGETVSSRPVDAMSDGVGVGRAMSDESGAVVSEVRAEYID